MPCTRMALAQQSLGQMELLQEGPVQMRTEKFSVFQRDVQHSCLSPELKMPQERP